MPGIDGLATGIDSTAIIDGLLKLQQQRIDLLRARQRDLRATQASFSNIEARLLSLRGTLTSLASTQSNIMSSRTAASTDESIVVATAGHQASVGTYALTVDRLAQRHQVATSGFANPTSEITQGKVTLTVGGNAPVEVVIDATNNTLQGLADAINASQAEVSASIVNDGGSGTHSYRLLLTSDRTGAQGAISLTNGLADGSGTAVKPIFDLANPVQQAQDAIVKLGSGAGAITITSATNQVDNLIPGVKLDLLSANAARPVTVTVSHNVEGAVTAVDDFVKAYNDVVNFLKEQSRYDATTSVAGRLLGNRSANEIQDQLQLAIARSVPGLASQVNRLSRIGVRLGNDGTLSFDKSKLTSILEGSDPSATAEDVVRLFSLAGQSTNNGLRFIIGSTRTTAGTVQVDVTSAAEQATIVGTQAVAASTTIDATNNQLRLKLDGSDEVTVSLAHGTYTADELAQQVQLAINSHSSLSGRSVSAVLQGGNLKLTSTSYGLASAIHVVSGSALASLGIAAGTADTGQDVVGRFIVNGKIEAATGRGQVLTGALDNANTADLQVRVTLGTTQIVAGVEGEINITRGFASALDKSLGDILDPTKGKLTNVNKGFDDRVEDIQETIDRLNKQFDARRESLVKQFVRLETSVSELQSLGNYLSSQFAGLSFGR